MCEQIMEKSLEALGKDWRNLKASLQDCDEIRIDFFQETFKNTEQCLRRFIEEKSISKEYLPLITDAYAFVDAQIGDDNVQIQAAKILTERMLYQYVVNEEVNLQNPSVVAVYLLEARRQLTVDFSNVATAFYILVEALQRA